MSITSEIISPNIQAYLEAHMTPLDANLLALHEASQSMPQGKIQSSLAHANLLRLLIGLLGAKRVLEVGTFTGFSALAMAQALPTDGKVVACEKTIEGIEFGRPYWARAGMAEKIDVRLGPALETLRALIVGQAPLFDLCYIDANKSQYPEYYEHCFNLTRCGGLIVADNTLFYGKVLEKADNNSVKGIQLMNQQIAKDPCVTALILPLSDGVTLVRKERARGEADYS